MTKPFTWDKFWIGTLIGLLSPQFFIFLYWLFEYSYMGYIPRFYQYLLMGKVMSPVISLCCIPNVGLLFLLMNKNLYRCGKGIILATILYGFLILYLKIQVEHTFNFD